ncbi:MAG: family 10 glycosylhydrolase, partial [Planctomycetia bacterium]|nr:family 10 glycosylhydrolase [Planctomycetia bacterium]
EALYSAYANDTEEPLALHEWRTTNINALIATVYHRIKETNPNVVFGISPQGNLDNNALINADVRTWMTQSGYVDYICPQLYFSFENAALPFETALDAWTTIDRADGVALYVGLALYKAGTDADGGTWLNDSDILARQIETAQAAQVSGVVLYAVDYLAEDAAQAEAENAREAIAALLQ